MMKSILTTIAFIALAVSGLAQTRSVIVNTSGVVQSPTNFWSADVTNARSGLGLGTAATNPASAFQPSSLALSNLASSNGGALTNLTAANITGTVALASNVTGTIAISNGGSGATTAGGARTNLGLGATNAVSFGVITAEGDVTIGSPSLGFGGTPKINLEEKLLLDGQWTIEGPLQIGGTNITAWQAETRTNLGLGWSALTNSNAANALLGYTTNNGNVVMPSSLTFSNNVSFSQSIFATTNAVNAGGTLFAGSGSTISFYATEDQSRWRTNLGLGWSALTNTSTSGFNASLYGSGTNPVLYNTNGEVVSPTNFWQVAPITTTFIESQPSSNSTTNISPARFLHIHSLTPAITVTNTIVLPTNTLTFEGDVALVVHRGPTNSLTKVRTSGSTNDLVTMNRFDESVEFVYYNDVWQFNHNQSFVEPIFFSGTNAAANAAASRTNLGLGGTNVVQFAGVVSPSLYSSSSNAQIELDDDAFILTAATAEFRQPISFNNTTNAAATRTNLGIPLAALTNTSNASFQAAIFNTNSVPTNSANVNAVNFNTAIHWMEVNVVTNGVTNNFRIPLFK